MAFHPSAEWGIQESRPQKHIHAGRRIRHQQETCPHSVLLPSTKTSCLLNAARPSTSMQQSKALVLMMILGAEEHKSDLAGPGSLRARMSLDLGVTGLPIGKALVML